MRVEEAVEAERRRWPGAAVVHRHVHGTDDPGEIAVQVRRWCRAELGREVVGGLFHAVSAGSVTGVELDDGSRRVVKAHQPQVTHAFLEAVMDVQTVLEGEGFPCAAPEAGPTPLGAGLATAETYLPDPGQPPSLGARDMASSAQSLHRLVSLAPKVEALRQHPMAPEGDGLYPRPHSPVFDFAATDAGAEWIDDLARRATTGMGAGVEVVAHMDWSARNVRFGVDGVHAVYDLDSLSIAPLSMVLAGAAGSWRSTGEPAEEPAPGVDEVEEWLAFWPDSLSSEVEAAVYASVVYHLAYTSRCEHAIDPDEREHRRARPTLRRDGRALLGRAGLRLD